MIKTCEYKNCPKEYTASKASQKFCSQACYIKFKTKTKPKCLLCPNPVNRNINKFCSPACQQKSSIIPKPKCLLCPNPVKNKRYSYCSPKCSMIASRKYATREEAKIAHMQQIRSRKVMIKHNMLSNPDKDIITQFYADRPTGYHVDHIIPLCKGGSHIMANLQYLTANENLRKKDKLPCEILLWYLIITSGKIGQESCPI